MIRVAVVGGGVAGLSAAFRLREELRASRMPHDIVLFEERDVCGGTTQTDHVAGFTLDHGPNGWLSNEPLTERLVAELGLSAELVPANDAAKHRFVFARRKLHRVPDSPGRFLASGLLRPWEKLRVAGELFIGGRNDDGDETIYDFGRRRLGRGFTETLLDPMVSGIVAGDIHRLSLPATFPRIRAMELEYGGLFKALFAKPRAAKHRHTGQQDSPSAGPAGPGGVLTTLRGGAGRLSEALARAIAPCISKNRAVSGLTRTEEGFVVWCGGSKECFDAVVMAAPAHRAAGIVQQMAPQATKVLEQIEFANVAVVCHAYDANTLGVSLNGFGHLIPHREGSRVLGCLWTSCIFPSQAPAGEVLLRTFLGGACDPGVLHLSDDQLIELVLESTADTLGITARPSSTWIFRHRSGIPQYTLGHRQRVAEIEQLCNELPGLAFVGASYRGPSLNRCIRDAYTIAPRVLQPFGFHPPSDGGDSTNPSRLESGQSSSLSS